MKELNAYESFYDAHEALTSISTLKDTCLSSDSSQKQPLQTRDLPDGLTPPKVCVTPPLRGSSPLATLKTQSLAPVPFASHSNEDRETCFPEVSSDDETYRDSSSLGDSSPNQPQKQFTPPASNRYRDSGVLISDSEEPLPPPARPSDANGNSPRDFKSLLTLKNRPVAHDFYAWNPPEPRSPWNLAKDYRPFHQCLKDDPEDLKDPVVNEALPISVKQRLYRIMHENKDMRPVLGTEMNFILIFLNEMHKINRFTRKHFPETCVYSSKPYRVLHFMITVSRNWTEHSALVESFKREAPIFWEVFGTSLQNGMMIPDDFQLENTNLKPGDAISHDRFTELVKLIRARRDSNLRPRGPSMK